MTMPARFGGHVIEFRSESGRKLAGSALRRLWLALRLHKQRCCAVPTTHDLTACCVQKPAVSLFRPLGHEFLIPAVAENPIRLIGRFTHSTTSTAVKGYGFITPSTGGKNIFCHARDVGDGVLLQASEQVRIFLLVSVWQLLICCQGRIRGQPRRERQGASNQRHCGRI